MSQIGGSTLFVSALRYLRLCVRKKEVVSRKVAKIAKKIEIEREKD